jgi:glycosyltransferase involved in cell wall biosynthesis
MQSIPVTALVMTKNEELNITKCVESLQRCSQVFVVDSSSSDDTVTLAKAAGAQVVNFAWNGKYPKKKQWMLDNLEFTNDWVLYVDADEAPSDELMSEIATAIEAAKDSKVAAFDIPLDYYFMGGRLRHGHRIVKRSLLNRHKARFPEIDDLDATNMWEVEGHYQPIISGRTERLDTPLVHEDRDPLYDFFDRHNRYSDWEAHLDQKPHIKDQVRQLRGRGGQMFHKLPFKPLAFFIYAFVVKAGWKDGRPGLDYAMAIAFYYWQTEMKKRELRMVGQNNTSISL